MDTCFWSTPPYVSSDHPHGHGYIYLCTHVPLSACFYIGFQSQSETENALRSMPSNNDNDNLPLVFQQKESLKVKGEWSSFGAMNDERKEN